MLFPAILVNQLVNNRCVPTGGLGFRHSKQLCLCVIELHMGVDVQRHADVRMTHDILQCLWIHSGFRHIGTEGVSAYMRGYFGHLDAIDIVVFLNNVLQIFLPVQCAPIPELTDTKNSRNMERKGAIEMETKKKKGTPPPRYDEAFKAGAVRMVTEQGRQPMEMAKDLGICIDTLRSWMKSSCIQMGQASRQNREQQRIQELEAENRALRKQLGEKE